jgi:rSAM/selenodomain-associated transferase 1
MLAARAPIPGETKTRLGRVIGMERAAALYEAFLRDLAAELAGPDTPYDVAWTYSPPEIDFAPWLDQIGAGRRPGVYLVPQEGPDWGTRQDALLRWGHARGYARTVLIATDSPQLARSVVVDAFAALQAHDVAMGRVLDGGYYLIGLAGYSPVLHEVPMSTNSAADALVTRAAALGRTLAELPPAFDVDEAEDLARLIAALAPDGARCPATWNALERLGLRDLDRDLQGEMRLP